MGLSLDSIFGEAKRAAETGMNDALQWGATAGLGFLEQKAIDLLHADKTKREAAFQQSATQALQQPGTPGSLGDYMSNLLQKPVLKEYGPYVIGGLAVFAVGVYLVTRK